MTLESLIETYGYAALALGTFAEGETVLVIAGFAAHRGYLSLPWVILVAFIGSLAGDQLFFLIGRFKGKPFLERRPSWRPKVQKVHRLLERHATAVVLGFRFLYGLRTVLPFVIGTTKIRTLRFMVLNAISAALWSVAVGTASYLFGAALERMLANLKRYELAVMAAMAGVGLVLWLAHQVRRRLGAERGS